MKRLLTLISSLWLCAAAAQPLVPMLPPAPPAVTPPPADPARTVALAGPLQVRAGATPAPSPAQRARIEELMGEVFADLPGLILLTDAPAVAEEPLPGYAANLATDLPEAATRVRLGLEAVRNQGQFAQEAVPVMVELIDAEGLSLGGRMVDYQPLNEEAFRGELTAFLGEQLETEGTQLAEDLTAPALEVWLGQAAGGSVIYFRGGAEGYVSLFLQAPDQPVRRLFPDAVLPANRVAAGRTYRYPASGALEGMTGVVRAVLTIPPSNTDQPGAAGEALRVVPSQQPVLFADQDLTLLFSLPGYLYNEAQVALPPAGPSQAGPGQERQ